MYPIEDLINHLDKLRGFAEQYYPPNSKACYLYDFIDELKSASETEQKQILLKIKSLLSGMGSLTDIVLMPPKTSNRSLHELNDEFRSLTDNVYAEIYRLLKN